MSTADRLLELAGLIFTALGAIIKGNPTNLEMALLRIAQAGVSTYEAQVGQPIDPSLLKRIESVP
jgi:hypothetical protein